MVTYDKFMGVNEFIKKHIGVGQHWNKKIKGLNSAVWQVLESDIWLDGCEYAKGSKFKVFESENFGWVVFGPGTKTPDGNTPGKRIIKW